MAKQVSKPYVVSGRITSPTEQPVAGLIVRAFDVDSTTAENQLEMKTLIFLYPASVG